MMNNGALKALTGRLFVLCPVVLLSFCASPPASIDFKPGSCPADMAWVGNGGFCIDRYEFPNRKGAAPLTGLSYPEALAVCKRLGKTIPKASDYQKACQGPEKKTYPYGNKLVKGKCRFGLQWPDGPAPSGSYPECVSGWGAYDMSGNLWEWLYAKRGNPPITGGAWNTTDKKVACNSRMGLFGRVHSPNIGFRCALYPKKKGGKHKAGRKKKRPKR